MTMTQLTLRATTPRKSNLAYGESLRAYMRGKSFRSRFKEPDASEFLSQLQAIGQRLLKESQSWILPLPSYGTTPAPVQGVKAEILQYVVTAIRDKQGLHFPYQSFNKPEPALRRPQDQQIVLLNSDEVLGTKERI